VLVLATSLGVLDLMTPTAKVYDGETSEGNELAELWISLCGLTGTSVNLLLNLGKLAFNVGGGVVQHNNLSVEISNAGCRLVLQVGGNISSHDVLDGYGKRLVVHLDRLYLSGQRTWGKDHEHTWLNDTSLNSANGY